MKKSLLFLAAALTLGMAAKAQTAWSEDFTGITSGMPTGWIVYADELVNSDNYSSFNKSWQVTQVSSDGNTAAASISWTEPQGNDCDRWMVTPQINVPASGYSLYFQVFGYNASYPEKVRVMVSTTGTEKTDFTEVADFVMDGTTYGPGMNDAIVDLSSYAGQNIYIAFVNHGDGYYTIVDDIAVKVMSANSIACTGVNAPGYAPMGGNFNFNVTVRNNGTAPLTSFQVDYTAGNGSQQTANVTGVNVAPFTTYTHTLSTSVNAIGTATLNVTVSLPNGQADDDASDNNASTSINVYDPSTATQRTSLLEHFTTGQCQYCPGGHERLQQAYQGYENRICWVSHHAGYGTDAMTINASEQLTALYGTEGTFAPAMTLDRNAETADGPGAGGVVGSVSDVNTISNQFMNATAMPAYLTINLSDLNYNPQTRQLSVTVNGQFIRDFAGAEPRLSLFITEDSILGRQANAATQSYINNYVNNHVIRATLSNIWGDADAFTTTAAGSTYSKTFTYTLPNTFRANKCRLVAFVNDYGTDMLHRTVANATQSDFLMTGNDPTVGITAVEASIAIKTYPNPATEMAYISAESTIRSYKMVDAMGRTILSEENVNVDMLELNVRDLAQGVYFISVTTDKGVASERLTIVK